MSLKVRCGLFERQQLLCSLFFHYLEFRENQEQLDFTQTHKLTVLHCVTPSVFLKIPPLMQRRPLAPFASLFCYVSASKVHVLAFLLSTAVITCGIFPSASTDFIFPLPQQHLHPSLGSHIRFGYPRLCFH